MSAGETLQRARSERKLSLADVTRETKIQPWVLEALESDRLQELMSPIYVKGLLTTYAKFLHLDAEPLVAQLPWPQAEPVQESSPPPAPAGPAVPVALVRSVVPALARMGLALSVSAAVIGLIITHPVHLRMPQFKARAASTKKASTLHTPAAPASVKSQSPKSPMLSSIAPIQEPVRAPELPTLAVVPAQPLELAVIATRTTWIQIRADGKLLTQQRLLRGANERWTAKKRFEVIVAKPTQIELTLNGKSITPFAIAHDGRLLITHAGITHLSDEAQ